MAIRHTLGVGRDDDECATIADSDVTGVEALRRLPQVAVSGVTVDNCDVRESWKPHLVDLAGKTTARAVREDWISGEATDDPALAVGHDVHDVAEPHQARCVLDSPPHRILDDPHHLCR